MDLTHPSNSLAAICELFTNAVNIQRLHPKGRADACYALQSLSDSGINRHLIWDKNLAAIHPDVPELFEALYRQGYSSMLQQEVGLTLGLWQGLFTCLGVDEHTGKTMYLTSIKEINNKRDQGFEALVDYAYAQSLPSGLLHVDEMLTNARWFLADGWVDQYYPGKREKLALALSLGLAGKEAVAVLTGYDAPVPDHNLPDLPEPELS